jgi:hypothetical protein
MMNILNAILKLPIWMPSALHPIEYTRSDQAGLIAPQVPRTLSSEATGHQLADD